MKELFKFIFSIKFLKTAGIAVGIGVGAIMLTFLWLRFFTNHGEEFSVPDFRGLNLAQVAELADEKDLNFVIHDSVYNAPAARGTVIEQVPPKDFMVKQGRTIFLSIKSLRAEMMAMPLLTKVTLPQAKADMETFGLKMGKLIYRPSQFENRVLDQQVNGKTIPVGEMIERGTRIDLILGKKRGMDNTKVPDLKGLTRTDAEYKVADYFMNIGEVYYDETVISYRDSAEATVRKQRPAKYASRRPGAEVKIWLSMVADSDTITTVLDGE